MPDTYEAEFHIKKVLSYREVFLAVRDNYLENLTIAMLENVIEEVGGFIEQIKDGGIDVEDYNKNV